MGRGYQDALVAAAATAELGFLRERARTAQRLKDWREAERLWGACWTRAPQDKNTAIGYIGVLIYAGQLARAEELAAAFARQYPNDENAAIFLARIAEARGDKAAAIQHWQAVLDIEPSKLQALIRLGDALLAEGRFEEARACAKRLRSRHPTEAHGVILEAKIIQEERGHKEAAPVWNAAFGEFPEDVHFLRAYGRALFAAGEDDECLAVAEGLRHIHPYESLRLEGQVLARRKPHADHTDFWIAAGAELPNNADFIRKLLHAALSAGRLDDAKTAMSRLIDGGHVRAGDADYAVGLANAEIAASDWQAARKDVRTFLRALRGRSDYRVGLLRLNRTIVALFTNQNSSKPRRCTPTERFLEALEKAPVTSAARRTLQDAVAIQNKLSEHRLSLFDTDVSRSQCRQFAEIVRDHLAQERAFSFVRLGDGESNALGYPGEYASHFAHDAAEREAIWWGQPGEPHERDALAARVRSAIAEADCLGIPTIPRFLRDVRLESVRPLQATRSGRGLLAVARALADPDQIKGWATRLLASAHLHQDLERWSLYPDLLRPRDEIVTISCHKSLPDALRSRFDVTVVRNIIIPPRHYSLSAFDSADCEPGRLPDVLGATIDQLEDWPRGRMVLVGAGYAGKVVLAEAARRGGVVLDVGSMLDYWVGMRTRSFQDIG